MKLLIVGSRSIKNFDLSPFISTEVDTIISGGATGVDALLNNMPTQTAFQNILSDLVTIYMGVPHRSNETNKWLILQMLCSSFGTVTQKERSIPFNMQRKAEKK